MIGNELRERILVGAAFVIVALAATLVAAALPLLVNALWSSNSEWIVLARELVPVVVGASAGYIVARRVAKCFASRSEGRRPRRTQGVRARVARHVGVILLAIGYLLTWAVGAPAAQTNLSRRTVEHFKSVWRDARPPEGTDYPYLASTVSVPLAPGIIATRFEYQVAGLDGWGGWVFHFWYLSDVEEIGTWTSWVS